MTPIVEAESDLAVLRDFVEDDDDQPSKDSRQKLQLFLPYVVCISYFFVAGFYGMKLFFIEAKWSTVMLTLVFYMMTLLGITAGAHRLFSHRSYKATVPLQVILMLFHCFTYQKTLFTWVVEHRLHHKYTDTDADPHNASRGFFFSHIGWLLIQKHPEVKKRANMIYMKDIYNNPVVMYQKRNARWLLPLCAFVIPTVLPWIFGETLWNSWFINMFRIIFTMNLTFLFNSASHQWGYRPYEKTMSASQNIYLIYIAMGEGFHNFHHVFPWDYRTGELGGNYKFNVITKFIDFCATFGFAYDLKVASEDMVKSRMSRTGDGTDLWGKKEDVRE